MPQAASLTTPRILRSWGVSLRRLRTASEKNNSASATKSSFCARNSYPIKENQSVKPSVIRLRLGCGDFNCTDAERQLYRRRTMDAGPGSVNREGPGRDAADVPMPDFVECRKMWQRRRLRISWAT